MKVTLLGFSSFISKKGNQCLVVGYGYEDSRWKGLHVEQKFVNPDCVEGLLKPGDEIIIMFDSRGFVTSVRGANS